MSIYDNLQKKKLKISLISQVFILMKSISISGIKHTISWAMEK
jgi:hypothetical protein